MRNGRGPGEHGPSYVRQYAPWVPNISSPGAVEQDPTNPRRGPAHPSSAPRLTPVPAPAPESAPLMTHESLPSEPAPLAQQAVVGSQVDEAHAAPGAAVGAAG